MELSAKVSTMQRGVLENHLHDCFWAQPYGVIFGDLPPPGCQTHSKVVKNVVYLLRLDDDELHSICMTAFKTVITW